MPAGEQYLQAASRYIVLGENLHRYAAAVSGWQLDLHIGPGPVSRLADERLTAIAGDLRTAGDEMTRLAELCRRRAAASAD